MAAAQAQFADNGSTSYTCTVDKGDGTTTTVTITLDSNGNLSGISPTSLTIKGHSVNCTANTGTNTITCTPQ